MMVRYPTRNRLHRESLSELSDGGEEEGDYEEYSTELGIMSSLICMLISKGQYEFLYIF
jgi:hypothetical protein